jgi:hypothetical protein
MHIYLRIDQLGEYSIREYFTYVDVLVGVGGISQSVFIPCLLILNYFTRLRFTASIISKLFTKKQAMEETPKTAHNSPKNTTNYNQLSKVSNSIPTEQTDR